MTQNEIIKKLYADARALVGQELKVRDGEETKTTPAVRKVAFNRKPILTADVYSLPIRLTLISGALFDTVLHAEFK